MKLKQDLRENEEHQQEIYSMFLQERKALEKAKYYRGELEQAKQSFLIQLSGLLQKLEGFTNLIPDKVKELQEDSISKEQYLQSISKLLTQFDKIAERISERGNQSLQILSKQSHNMEKSIDRVKNILEDHRNQSKPIGRNQLISSKELLKDINEEAIRIKALYDWIKIRLQMIENGNPNRFKNELLLKIRSGNTKELLQLQILYSKALRAIMMSNYSLLERCQSKRVEEFERNITETICRWKFDPTVVKTDFKAIYKTRNDIQRDLETDFHRSRYSLQMTSDIMDSIQRLLKTTVSKEVKTSLHQLSSNLLRQQESLSSLYNQKQELMQNLKRTMTMASGQAKELQQKTKKQEFLFRKSMMDISSPI